RLREHARAAAPRLPGDAGVTLVAGAVSGAPLAVRGRAKEDVEALADREVAVLGAVRAQVPAPDVSPPLEKAAVGACRQAIDAVCTATGMIASGGRHLHSAWVSYRTRLRNRLQAGSYSAVPRLRGERNR